MVFVFFVGYIGDVQCVLCGLLDVYLCVFGGVVVGYCELFEFFVVEFDQVCIEVL